MCKKSSTALPDSITKYHILKVKSSSIFIHTYFDVALSKSTLPIHSMIRFFRKLHLNKRQCHALRLNWFLVHLSTLVSRKGHSVLSSLDKLPANPTAQPSKCAKLCQILLLLHPTYSLLLSKYLTKGLKPIENIRTVRTLLFAQLIFYNKVKM